MVGVLINRLVFGGERVAFIMELPLYHLPNPRTIDLSVWHNIVAFLRHAGTVIVIVSAVVGFWRPSPDRRSRTAQFHSLLSG